MKSSRSFFASLFGSRVARNSAERAGAVRRSKKFMRDALLDLLEERQLLASLFSYTGGVLTIDAQDPGTALSIQATATSGTTGQ